MGIACIASVSARVRLETLATQATMGLKMKKWLTNSSLNYEKNLNSFKKSIERFKLFDNLLK